VPVHLRHVPDVQRPYLNDEPAWQDNSRKILELFSTNRVPAVLERMAKACPILPSRSANELTAAAQMAELAVRGNAGRKAPESFRLVRALAEYRRERFLVTLRWLDGAAQESEPAREAQADAIRAMAQYRRGERDTAQATLTKAAGLADSLVIKGPTLNAQWPERLMAAVLVREAKALVEPKSDK
jgi:hypothetical protein